MEYSESKAVLAANWSWGSFAIGKDFLEWGYSESGLLVVFQKPPSYGFIRLDIKPVEWLKFNYMHGWLSSIIPDSNSFFYNEAGTISFSYVNKHFLKAADLLLANEDVSIFQLALHGLGV